MQEQLLQLYEQKIQVDLKIEEQRIKVEATNAWKNHRRLLEILAERIECTTNTNSS